MKLQKFLSQSGVCSRRKAEEYIEQGLVMVNDIVAHIGQVIDPEKDIVKFSDKIIDDQENLVYYVFNKPRDIVTTCLKTPLGRGDTAKREGGSVSETKNPQSSTNSDSSLQREFSILDIVDIPERVFPIGRLDKETTGLIILTNDGRLSNYLMHPRYEHEKEYVVEVYGKIEDEALEQMRKGVRIELKDNGSRTPLRKGGVAKRRGDWSSETIPNQPSVSQTRQFLSQGAMKTYKTKPCDITRLSSSKFAITIREGKNRQIRRMVEVVGHDVKRLKRIRIENIMLGDLMEGEWRRFTESEKRGVLERIVGEDIG